MACREDVIRIVATCASGLLVCCSLPTLVRSGPALLLVLYLPGAGIVAAVLGRSLPAPETIIMSIGLSFASCGLSALILNLFHALNVVGWAAALTGVSLTGSIAALMQKDSCVSRRDAAPRAVLPPQRVLLLALACILAAGAVMLAAKGAVSQREFRFTDFWMVPSQSTMSSRAVVGVHNEEAQSVRYAIEIVSRGTLSDVSPTFTLAPGETRTFFVALPTIVFRPSTDDGQPTEVRRDDKTDAERVEARLFRDGDRSVVYRRVWLAMPPVVTPIGPQLVRPQAGNAMATGDAVTQFVLPPGVETRSQVQNLGPLRAPLAATQNNLKSR